jgi:hypothetical protein
MSNLSVPRSEGGFIIPLSRTRIRSISAGEHCISLVTSCTLSHSRVNQSADAKSVLYANNVRKHRRDSGMMLLAEAGTLVLGLSVLRSAKVNVRLKGLRELIFLRPHTNCATPALSQCSLPRYRQAQTQQASRVVHRRVQRFVTCQRLRYLSRRIFDRDSRPFLLCRALQIPKGVSFAERLQCFLLEHPL